jgi:hypothetical protein
LNCNTISFSIETNVKKVLLAKNGAGDRNLTKHVKANIHIDHGKYESRKGT